MRLIDADKIEVDEGCIFTGKGIKAFLDAISDAYDVDKVVEQLEEMREEMLTDTAYDNDTVNHYLGYADLMIEIVKSGGIE